MSSILFRIAGISRSQFKCIYFQKEKLFINFYSIYGIYIKFRKNVIVIGNVFLELETERKLLISLSKKRCLKTPFVSQHVKAS